jgi:hypothetical protein
VRVVNEIARCPHCATELAFKRYNARFGDEGFMYCDRDCTVVTWSSYDPIYSRLSVMGDRLNGETMNV